jgi:hypothetical protein
MKRSPYRIVNLLLLVVLFFAWSVILRVGHCA